MYSVRFFKRSQKTFRFFYPRYYTAVKKKLYIYSSPMDNRSSQSNVILESFKSISNYSSMQTKGSDSANEKSDYEKTKKILEDEDFKNILKDFANDFGVDSETNDLLDDIRKNIDDDHKKSNLAKESHTTSDINSPVLGGGLDLKYKEFSDVDSKIIHSYEEDAYKNEVYHIDQELKPKFLYNNVKRGVTGVFDIDEMVQVLHHESLLDVTAISIPKELHYADFLVIVTAKSARHCEAVAESIKKLYKQKKNKADPFVRIEGEDVSNWKVMDMGNIVLHIFLEETRALYDLESLWLLDSKYDSGGTAQPDPMLNILEEQLAFFNSLQQSNASDLPEEPS